MSFEASVELLIVDNRGEHSWIPCTTKLVGKTLHFYHSSEAGAEAFRSFSLNEFDVADEAGAGKYPQSKEKSHVLTLVQKEEFVLPTDPSSIALLLAFQDAEVQEKLTRLVRSVFVLNRAATIIQKNYRTGKLRRNFYTFVQYTVARARSQRKLDLITNGVSKEMDRSYAATVIQTTYRRYNAKKKWKSIITFKHDANAEDNKNDTAIEDTNFMKFTSDDASLIQFKEKEEKKKSSFSLRKKKSKPSGNQVAAAKVPKLVEYLCRESNASNSTFSEIFFATLPHFSTTFQGMQYLTAYFKSAPKVQQPKIIELVAMWAVKYHKDFTTDTMRKRFQALLAEIEKDMGAATAKGLEATIEKASYPMEVETRMKDLPAIIYKVKDPKSIGDLSEVEMARQLTLMSSATFKRVNIREFNQLAWEKKGKERKAPNLLVFIDRFNKICSWAMQSILETRTIEQGVQIIEKFIRVADQCRQLNNFSDLMSIMSALQHSTISRLQRRWDAVDKKDMKTFNSLATLVDLTSNYKNLRKATKEVSPPLVPFVGIWLQDLIFIEENPTYVNGGMVNYEKMEMIYDILAKVKRAHDSEYKFMPEPKIQELLWPESIIAPKILYAKSLQIEPRRQDSMDPSKLGLARK